MSSGRPKDELATLTEVVSQELHALRGDEVVAPLPVEHLLEVVSRLKRFDNHHDFEVGNFLQVLVLGQVSVLLAANHALLQQVFEDSSFIFLGHKNHFYVLLLSN